MLNFDEIEAIHNHQTSSYPRVEDTNSLDCRPNVDTAMEDVAEIPSITASVNLVDIEISFWKASLDGCKDALLLLRLSKDDEDDRVHEKQFDVLVCSHLNITGVDSSQALSRRDPTVPEPFGQSGRDPRMQEEHNISLDTVDYKMDVYEALMCDPSNGGVDAFFRLEHLSRAANVPHNKVSLFFPYFHKVKLEAFPCRLFFFPYFFPIS